MFRRRNDIWCERYGARGERTNKKQNKKNGEAKPKVKGFGGGER